MSQDGAQHFTSHLVFMSFGPQVTIHIMLYILLFFSRGHIHKMKVVEEQQVIAF